MSFILDGRLPNENLFERPRKRFLFINLGEKKDVRFRLLGWKERVLKSPQASPICIKNVSETVLHLNFCRSITTKSVVIFIY